jgi:hypothetical protein
MSYRYLDEGNANAGTITCFNIVTCADVNYTLRDIASHDMRIGMRWTFNEPPHPLPASDAPVARKY